MYGKKVVLLLALPLILSSNKIEQGKIIIVACREPETMFGDIKQVIEARQDIAEPQLCPMDTTVFDKKTNPIETKLGITARSFGITNYVVSYDKLGKKTETINYPDKKEIFKLDGSNNLNEYFFENNDNSVTFHLYGHKIKESILYVHKKILVREKYKYRDDGLLSELAFYSKSGVLTDQDFYKCISIDRHGNWIKRVVIDTYKLGDRKDTVTRKITYY